MSHTRRGLPPHTLISLIAALAVLVLAFLGSVAYWRLESQAWASHRQTQVALDPLTQQLERLDVKMAAVVQTLEALQSRVDALEIESRQWVSLREELEAVKQGQIALQSNVVALERRLDDISVIQEKSESQGPERGGDSGTTPTVSPERALPESTSLGVPLYRQSHTLSCEAATASMVAAFFGVSLSEEEAIAALPRHENPNLGFRGDIDGPPGGLDDYGVHAAPIQKLLIEHGLQANEIEGGLEGIRSALEAGHPVIAWVTYRLWEKSPVNLELANGATITMVPYEHTVVVEGYTTKGLWALDPYDGERQLLLWADFERSWGYLGQMALEITGP